jgi:hypothetical protein
MSLNFDTSVIKDTVGNMVNVLIGPILPILIVVIILILIWSIPNNKFKIVGSIAVIVYIVKVVAKEEFQPLINMLFN